MAMLTMTSMVAPSRGVLVQLEGLLMTSSSTDMELAAPNKQVTHIQHPDSLHQCLKQLNGALRSAFDEADQKMSAVQDMFCDIPEVFDEIQNIFLKGKISDHGCVDGLIDQILSRWETCVDDTKHCANKFDKVRLLICEINDLCVVKNRALDEHIEKINNQKLDLSSDLEYKQRERADIQNRVRQARDSVEEAQRRLNNAMRPNHMSFVPIVCHFISQATKAPVIDSAKRRLEAEIRRYERCQSRLASIEHEIAALGSRSNDLERSKQSLNDMKDFLKISTAECAKVLQGWVNAQRFFAAIADQVSLNNSVRIKEFTGVAGRLVGKKMSRLKIKHLKEKGDSAMQEIRKTDKIVQRFTPNVRRSRRKRRTIRLT